MREQKLVSGYMYLSFKVGLKTILKDENSYFFPPVFSRIIDQNHYKKIQVSKNALSEFDETRFVEN